MGISAILNIAVSGMQANTRSLTTSAQNVANAMTPGYRRQVTSFAADASGGVTTTVHTSGATHLPDTSDVDLGQEMLDAIQAEIGFKANAAVWETGADMWDVLASIKRD
ncbi:flagellar basal body protein [Ciceribacter sp. RN22]|uniref:flagellar basal body protein n=1 Tax=Ciceribacter sp. RN22 TaxID=2954932 RepID=UPI002091F16B|nr:flagellar basal body protein [Ciceribacter sp. RN22]MCO6178501.1 flagellar basal body protein [Ciceribacter sp. RN22]